MRRFVLLCALLAFFCVGKAQNEEARYNYIHKTITRHADGSTDLNVRMSLTLFTHTAMNSNYGETYVLYNSEHQKVTVNEAYTIQKEGKKVPQPERAVCDVLPSWAAKASDFNQMKEKVIVHTGLDLGCTIYVDYTLHSEAGFNKNFDFNEQIDQTSPITRQTYTLCVPKGEKLTAKVYSPAGAVSPQSDEIVGEQRIVKYEIDSLPARSKDIYQLGDVTRHYNFYCTTSDFETEMQQLFYSPIDSYIQEWADKVVRQEPDAKKRLNTIREYLSDEFEVVNIPLNLAGGLRPMKKVAHGAYITPFEQAAMMNQMLRACNIKSDVRVAFAESLPKEFRTLNNVKRYYVTHRYGEEEKTMNPSDKSTYVEPTMAVGLDREIVKPKKDKEVRKEYQLEVKMSDLGDREFFVLELPVNHEGVAGWNVHTLPTLREVDFEIPTIINETETYNIKVGDGLKMVGDYATSLSDPQTGIEMVERCEVSTDGSLVVTRFVSLPQKTYSVEGYAAVRNIITTWVSPNRRRLLFVKK